MSAVVSAAAAARAALEAAEGSAAVAIVACIADGAPVRRIIVRDDGTLTGTFGDAELDARAVQLALAALRAASHEPVLERTDDALLYIETHCAPERLVIVGAGHIAVPLAHLGVLLEFEVTVLDDREEFATSDRFDDEVRVLRADFATDPFAGVRIDGRTYLALVTRGHRWDFDCLQRIMSFPAAPRYIGMIGSRRRVRAALTALLHAGVPRAALATIRAPIGIELQAETPAEIAVAIAAELVAVRRGADVASISTREQVLERFLSEQPI